MLEAATEGSPDTTEKLGTWDFKPNPVVREQPVKKKANHRNRRPPPLWGSYLPTAGRERAILRRKTGIISILQISCAAVLTTFVYPGILLHKTIVCSKW